MHVVKEIDDLQSIINKEKAAGKCIGFVPTMGALHQGHLSLVGEAAKQCDFVVMSIFVNPTQFNDANDLENYPRTLDSDLALLETTACQLVFVPSVTTIYPTEDTRQFNFGSIETVMEGAFRPGHFNGVAQVVSRLFEIVQPNCAFFGQKDFQQFAIIKAMTKQLNLDLNVISCPIVREDSGLAMSSRNQRLNATQRADATKIYQSLIWAKEHMNELSVNELKDELIAQINRIDSLEVEYVEIADAASLQSIRNWQDADGIVLCVAVFCGEIRLIDNIILK